MASKPFKKVEPREVEGGWACALCPSTFTSKASAWGHTGRAHPGARPPFKHGCIAGYLTHKRRGENACPGCLSAWRLYYQLKRANKKGLL